MQSYKGRQGDKKRRNDTPRKGNRKEKQKYIRKSGENKDREKTERWKIFGNRKTKTKKNQRETAKGEKIQETRVQTEPVRHQSNRNIAFATSVMTDRSDIRI